MSSPRQAPLKLHVVVVGCGIGGLAAAYCLGRSGHKVTVLESASAIGEVGAGIQISPNISRLLFRWGLRDALSTYAVELEAIVIRRYSTGEHVGYRRLGRYADPTSEPYCSIHRADYHKLLYDLAAPYMTLRLNSKVVSVDPDTPSLTLVSGEVVHGDLIIGADGIKSYIQKIVLGEANAALATGDAVYRAIIPSELMLADDDLRTFIEKREMTIWMGPERHIVGYPLRGGQLYNFVMAHPDDGSIESWTAPGNVEKMRTDYADFEPRIRKMMQLVNSTLDWRLMDRLPLATWNHPSGRVTLLGDACHPMLPYRAQGAAMAIEDAAVLGNLLSHITSLSQLPAFLKAYESLRLKRTADTQADSRLNQSLFHLPDGPEQERRDAGMRKAMEVELKAMEARSYLDEKAKNDALSGNPNQWADVKKTDAQFGYDADEAVQRWWSEGGEEEIMRAAI